MKSTQPKTQSCNELTPCYRLVINEPISECVRVSCDSGVARVMKLGGGDRTGAEGARFLERFWGMLPQEIILSAESLKRYFYHFLNFDNLKLNLNRYRSPQHFSPLHLEKSQNRLLKRVAPPPVLSLATPLAQPLACDQLAPLLATAC